MNDKESLEKQLQEKEKEIKKLELKIAEQNKKIDEVEGKRHIQELVIEELLNIIEKKDFQRVAQILRSYGIKSEKADVLVNEAEVIKETSSNEEKETAKEIENALKGKDDKKKPGRKKGTHNYQDFDLSKISIIV